MSSLLVALILIAIALFIFVCYICLHGNISSDERLKLFFSSLSSIATIVALCVGGYWTYTLFVKHRDGRPKAELTQRVTFVQLPGTLRLLHVDTTIRNTGTVLLPITVAEARLDRVLPIKTNAFESEVKERAALQQLNRDDRTIAWPTLQRIELAWAPGEFQIEPGESDNLEYDFVVDDNVEVASIFIRVTNAADGDLGWNASKLYDIKSGNEL